MSISLCYDLQSATDLERAKVLSKFFQTHPGGYGEGDEFLGLRVPYMRKVAKRYQDSVNLKDIEALLQSDIHEYRFTALILLSHKYRKSTSKKSDHVLSPQMYVNWYINHLDRVNNRDLVDVSAYNILGDHLVTTQQQPEILYTLSGSSSLWHRRVAIVATMSFIKQSIFDPTLDITRTLLSDPEDLIHKACGRMLREVGKQSYHTLRKFLTTTHQDMPRTMLRYAIEKFPEDKRKQVLQGNI